jgi:hypothetical protein
MCKQSLAYLATLMSIATLGCGLDRNAPDDGPVDKNDSSASLTSAGSASASDGADDSAGNSQAACEELEDTLAGCVPSLEGSLQCSMYADATCDLEAYFECVNDAYGTCQNGTFPNADPTALMDCASLGVC